MANVTKRVNKSGQTSYLIRAFIEQGAGGRQITKSMTWKPPAGMKPSAADKQAEKEAVLFEEKVRSGVVSIDGKTKFGEYAARWMETAQLAPKTREQYDYLLERIKQAIGHIPLEKLRADHLQSFYKNLREEGVKGAGYAVSIDLDQKRKDAKLTYTKLAELSGVSRETVSAACRGERVSIKSAQRISEGFGMETSALFTVEKGTATLSARTVWHYHKLIRAILASAKQTRIVLYNVAADHMEAPKLPRDEARYLTDEDARSFLSALQTEPDIRIKTALTLELFTGLRRGELCGLEWPDIDFKERIIHVRRASQPVSGQGVVEVPTKNKSSARSLTVPPFVTSLLSEYQLWWEANKRSLGDAWRGDQQRLFIKGDGSPIYPSTINFWLRGFIKRNNLPEATPHTLRHTFASLQLTAGQGLISAPCKRGQDTLRRQRC